jgi:hypothetical protein
MLRTKHSWQGKLEKAFAMNFGIDPPPSHERLFKNALPGHPRTPDLSVPVRRDQHGKTTFLLRRSFDFFRLLTDPRCSVDPNFPSQNYSCRSSHLMT